MEKAIIDAAEVNLPFSKKKVKYLPKEKLSANEGSFSDMF
jgi:hypothetical protein